MTGLSNCKYCGSAVAIQLHVDGEYVPLAEITCQNPLCPKHPNITMSLLRGSEEDLANLWNKMMEADTE